MRARPDTEPVETPRVKGTAILGIAASVREILGEEIHARAMASLSVAVRDALRYRTITPGSWVPLAWHVELHDAVLVAAGSGPILFRRIAKHTTLEHLRGVYKVFARVAGPEAVLARAAPILRTYYSRANIEVAEVRKGFCRTEFAGCEGFTPPIWENICGACEAILDASGAGSVRIRMSPHEHAGETVPGAMTINAHWV